MLQTASFRDEHQIVEIRRLRRFQVLHELRHDRGVDNHERLGSKIQLIDLSNSFNLDGLLEPFSHGFKQARVNPEVAIVALVHNASTFLLAEPVDASCALIIAVERYSNTAVPRQVDHFEPLRVPYVCLHPAVLFLSDFVQMH